MHNSGEQMDSVQTNPFETPAAELQEPAIKVPIYRLSAVGLATFLGSPLAGGWILTQNLKRLGRSAEVTQTWLITVGLTLALSAAAYFLPADLPAVPLNVAAASAMYFGAQAYFGKALDRYVADGGSFHSNWRAAGVGFLVATVASLLIAAVVFTL